MPSFDIAKATAKAKFTLEKKGLPSATAQVGVALDVSGSTAALYRDGLMQSAFEVTLPVANCVDLNKEIDVYTFSSGDSIHHIDPPATIANYADYVKKHIINGVGIGGGTSYAPVIRKALKDFGFYKSGLFGGTKLLSKSSKGDPVLFYFLTDGENDDHRDTTDLFDAMEKAGTCFYVNFLGIGHANFTFIEQLGVRFGNVGFTRAANLASFVGSDDLYDQLIPTEFTEWMAKQMANA